MMRTSFFLLAVLFHAALHGQEAGGMLKGRVVASDSTPIARVTVTMMDTVLHTLAHAVTDSSGQFGMVVPKSTSFVLTASHAGYDTWHSPLMHAGRQDWVPVVLSRKGAVMDAVMVESARPLLDVSGGTITYHVGKSMDAQGANALDVLRKAPGVNVQNDQTISLNGKAGVLVLLDGKQTYLSGAELADLLRSMPASQIRAIEIINSPSAKYDASGSAGIIHIRTARPPGQGLTGTVTAGISYGINARQNTDVSLNYRSGKVNLFGSYNHFLGHYTYVYGTDRAQGGKWYNSVTDDTDKRQRAGARLGMDYSIGKKNTAGILLTGNFIRGGGITRTSTDIGLQGTAFPEQHLDAVNDYYFQQTDRYLVSANYRYENGNTLLNLDLDWGSFKKDNGNHQDNIYSDPQHLVTDARRYHSLNGIDMRLRGLKLDYARDLWKGTLEAGGKVSSIRSGNEARFYHRKGWGDSLDHRRTNLFSFQEDLTALYLNYKRGKGKWSWSAGLRMEHTASEGALFFRDGGKDSTRNTPGRSTGFFPSFQLTFKPSGPHQYSLSYSRRIERPAYPDLNPFVYLLDELSFWQGNPYLQPQLSHRALLQYVYRNNTILGLSFAHTDGFSTRITDTVESVKIVMVPRNLGTQRNLALLVTQNLTLRKGWEVSLNGTLYQLQNRVAFDRFRNLALQQVAARGSMQHRVKLPFSLSGEVSFYINSRRLIGANEVSRSTSQLDLGLQKTLWKGRGTVRLLLNDLYQGTRSYSVQSFSGFHLTSFAYYETRQLRLNFTYKFADNSIKSPRTRSSALESESGRIR